MTQKTFTFILAVFTFALVACGSSGGTRNKAPTSDSSQSTTNTGDGSTTEPVDPTSPPTNSREQCKTTFVAQLADTIGNTCSGCHEGGSGEDYFPVIFEDDDANFDSFLNEYISDYNKDIQSLLAYIKGSGHPGRRAVTQNFENSLKGFDRDCNSL